jgi:glutamate synthase (NADPH/NADH) small chain
VAIGKIERYVADWAAANNISNITTAPKNGKTVAICGSGPAGLTCAGELARKGYQVTVYEALHTFGGVLSYGIPEFRLPKSVVSREVKNLESMGVDIQCNVIIGKTLTIDELFEMGYDAVFIGTGAGLPQLMKIPGEGSVGVYTANEYLTRINLMHAYNSDAPTPVIHAKKAIVVGGGNVAMDAARCARRMGAEVHIVYRRSDAELPARAEEVHHAREEGIIFDTLTAPLEVLCDDKRCVTGMRCIKMELGEPDASGRRRPIQIPGSELDIDADIIIIAIGTTPNPLMIRTTPGLDATKIGGIQADDTCATSRNHVYAGGDITSGAATVILAMGAGKKAAESIDKELMGK